MRAKITIIGAGNVGGATAQWLVSENLGDIVMVDRTESKAKGKALDILQSGAVVDFSGVVFGTSDYKDTKDSDIIIVTAGSPRKPGMSRDELFKINKQIVEDVVKAAAQFSPGAILIVVTNPLDPMTYVGWKAGGFSAKRVLGMAGILDTSRMRSFIAEELRVSGRVSERVSEKNVSTKDISAMVLGGHGDSMVPLMRLVEVCGKPLTDFLPKEKIDAIAERTRNGGAEIVSLLKTGSAYVAPGAAIMEMCKAILRDEKTVLPCSAYLEGEYGASGFFIGVPVMLGREGVSKIVEIELNDEEKAAFQKTAAHVKASLQLSPQ